MFRLFADQAAQQRCRLGRAGRRRLLPAGQERLPPEPRIQANPAADLKVAAATGRCGADQLTAGSTSRRASCACPIDVAMKLVLERRGCPSVSPRPPLRRRARRPPPAAPQARLNGRSAMKSWSASARARTVRSPSASQVAAAAPVHGRGVPAAAPTRRPVGARARRARQGRHRSEAGRADPARRWRSATRTGRPVTLRRLLRQAAGRADAGLLRVPDALHAGAQRRGRRRSRSLNFTVGDEFDVVTVSFNPKETPAMAAAKKADVPREVRPARGRDGLALPDGRAAGDRRAGRGGRLPLHVRPGDAAVRARERHHGADAAGPRVEVLLRDRLPAADLRLGLIEASGGKIGTPVDQVLLYCYHYDPHSGKYSMVVMNVLRLAGVVTVALIGGFIVADVAPGPPEIEGRRGGRAAGVASIAYASDPDPARRRPPRWRPRWTRSTSSWSR